METTQRKIIDSIPYNRGIGEQVTFWAFQAPEAQDPSLVARMLNITENQAIKAGLKVDLTQYRDTPTALLQIPQTPEILVRTRDKLIPKGITLGLRYLNSKRLNIDTLLGMVSGKQDYPEIVMNCPYNPALIDITDSDKVKTYSESTKDRYKRKFNLESEIEYGILRSAGKGIVPYSRIIIPQRPEWIRIILGHDPKNTGFTAVTADKIAEYLINKSKPESAVATAQKTSAYANETPDECMAREIAEASRDREKREQEKKENVTYTQRAEDIIAPKPKVTETQKIDMSHAENQ